MSGDIKNQSNQEQPQQRRPFPLLAKIINGGIAGIVGVTCIFPIDLVKTRLQNQQLGPNGEKMYKNMLDCFMKTYRTEGYFGMYRGSSVNILLVAPEKAIKLAANDYFRYKLTTSDGRLPLNSQMVAGGLAGFFQSLITTPMELIKIQMQDAGRVQAHAKLFGETVERVSATELTTGLLKQRGFFGLYKGFGVTAVRDIIFSVIYFPLFSSINDWGPRRNDGSGEAVAWCSLVGGLISGTVSAFLCTPFDVVKTRLQAIKKAAGEKEFTGTFDCIAKTLKYEGPTAFFKGGLCRIMVLAPLYGIAQVVYFLGIGEAIVKLIYG